MRAPAWNGVAGYILLGLIGCVPLALATKSYVYFDITPKVVAVLVCGAVAAVTMAFRYGTVGPLLSPEARWFCIVTAVQVLCVTLATFNSVNPSVSLVGCTWRRFGLLPRLAIAAVALSLLLLLVERTSRIQWFLRISVASGVIAAIYSIAQYFDLDPWIPAGGYRESYWGTVRPPSSLGHAGFFAAFADLICFLGLAVTLSNKKFDRVLGVAGMVTSVIAIVLSGTRAGLLGLLAGGMAVLLFHRTKPSARVLAATGLFLIGVVTFTVSSPGTVLRNRLRAWLGDARGGTRLLLWRDTLKMGFNSGWLGFGPETFSQVFPLYESDDLARNFPNHYHESPHNILLDTWTEGGSPALAAFAALVGLIIVCTKRSPPETRPVAIALFAALSAMFVAQQFTPVTISCALFGMATAAALVALIGRSQTAQIREERASPALGTIAIAAALFFVGAAIRYDAFDSGLKSVSRALQAGRIEDALMLYRANAAWQPLDRTADLWFSRTLVASLQKSGDPMLRRRAWDDAIEGAERAAVSSEERANAYYHLAALRAFNEDLPQTERSLRMAIVFAPKWYKPHLLLARLLEETGRPEEAAKERIAAGRLGGNGEADAARQTGVSGIRDSRSSTRGKQP